jgi:hypothetical protein
MPVDITHLVVGFVFLFVWALVGQIVTSGRPVYQPAELPTNKAI